MIKPRIIARDTLGPALRAEPSKDPRRTCSRAIRLDGTRYRCGREVRRTDAQHDGIHDAFKTHGDGGAIRW